MKNYWYIKYVFALALAIVAICILILHALGDLEGELFLIIVFGILCYWAVKVEMEIEERNK